MTRGTSTRPAIIVIAQTLRNLRQESGVSLRHVARKTKISPSRLSGLETGRRADATTLAYLLGVIGAPVTTLNQIIDLADRVDEYDFFDPNGRDEDMMRAGFERLSTHIFEWSPALFPKTLRSAGYSRALHESGLPNPDTTTRDLVSSEARAGSADGSEPLYTFLLGAAATRPDACSPSVLYDQIEEVATVSKLLRLYISVVPESFCPTGLVEPFTLYEDHLGAFAVAIPHHCGAAFLTNEASVKWYAKTAKWLSSGIDKNPWP